MLKLRLILIFLFSSLWQTNLFCQSYSFISFGPNEGIGQSQVTALVQEKNGLVWIGTKGAGVSVFDGRSVQKITLKDGLPDANITCLFKDGKDRVWIGTQKGIAYSEENKIYKINDYRLRDDEITAITEDFKGNIWIGSKRNGVSLWNNGKITSYGINDGLGFSKVSALACDSTGTIWIGSDSYGFVGFRENRFFKPLFISESSFQVRSFLPDTRFTVLVFTDKGVFRVNNRMAQPWDLYPISSKDQESILFGVRDKKGTLWFAIEGNGVLRMNSNKELFKFNTENGLPSDKVITIMESEQGRVWLGTDGGGVALFRGESMNKYGLSEGITNQQIRSVFKEDSTILIGTEGGLFYSHNQSFKQFPETGELSILCIRKTEDGNLLCGTETGLFVTHGETGKSIPIINKGSPIEVRSIYALNEKAYLLGTSDGVLQYDGSNVMMRYKDSLPVGMVYQIVSSTMGLVFCTEWGAFFQNKNGQIKRIPLKDPYGNLDAVAAEEHSSGALFIITGRGLCRIYNDQTKLFTEKDGLPSSNLYQIGIYDNIVWLGSDKGLTKINLDKNLNPSEISTFGRQEGFEGVECNSGSMLIEPSGKVWSGTIKGLYSYDSAKEENARKPVPLFIRNISIHFEPISIDSFSKIQALEWKNNHLTFEYSAPEFIHPNQTRFSFFLKGFDKEWSPLQKENIVTYSNLPNGDYTLLARAMTGNGLWSESEEIHFSILPPFWKTTWFRLIVILFVTAMFFLLLKWRTGRLEKVKRLLEEKVRERTSELNEQKKELEKLSIVASHMNDGVLICDASGRIEYINAGFYRMSGYTPEEYKNSAFGNANTLQELSSIDTINELIGLLRTEGKAVIYDSSHINKFGQEIWTRGSLAPILDTEGELVKIVAIYTDITDRKLAEQALEETNRNILDSIVYAKRIQEAILPSTSVMENVFPDSFVFYQPRDIVSGDFYWFGVIRDHFIWAVADCTGHGVPGALMSMIGNEFLHQIVNNELVSGAEQVLFLLDKQITRALHQEGSMKESRDGMDIGLCVIHLKSGLCQYAGANTSMFRVRKNEVEEYEGAKESIGGYKETGKEYYSHEFFLDVGDELYISTDGYLDQFGGDRNKKFMKRRFIEFLQKTSGKKAEDKKNLFYQNLIDWMGENKQVDDILVVGLKNHHRFSSKNEEG